MPTGRFRSENDISSVLYDSVINEYTKYKLIWQIQYEISKYTINNIFEWESQLIDCQVTSCCTSLKAWLLNLWARYTSIRCLLFLLSCRECRKALEDLIFTFPRHWMVTMAARRDRGGRRGTRVIRFFCEWGKGWLRLRVQVMPRV